MYSYHTVCSCLFFWPLLLSSLHFNYLVISYLFIFPNNFRNYFLLSSLLLWFLFIFCLVFLYLSCPPLCHFIFFYFISILSWLALFDLMPSFISIQLWLQNTHSHWLFWHIFSLYSLLLLYDTWACGMASFQLKKTFLQTQYVILLCWVEPERPEV